MTVSKERLHRHPRRLACFLPLEHFHGPMRLLNPLLRSNSAHQRVPFPYAFCVGDPCALQRGHPVHLQLYNTRIKTQ